MMIGRHGIREGEDGIEVMCDACADWWSPTAEFWPRSAPDRGRRLAFARCRACHNAGERRRYANPDPKARKAAAQAKYRRANLVAVRFIDRENKRAQRKERAA